MRRQKNKALALLASLGIVGGSNALENAPIQELNAGVQQIHYLSTDRTKTAELMQTVEKLTATLRILNEQVENNLHRIDKTGFHLLDTLHGVLRLAFKATKNLFTEEELYTTYYGSMRPFSDQIRILKVKLGVIRQELGFFKVVDTGVMTQEEIASMIKQLDNADRKYVEARS